MAYRILYHIACVMLLCVCLQMNVLRKALQTAVRATQLTEHIIDTVANKTGHNNTAIIAELRQLQRDSRCPDVGLYPLIGRIWEHVPNYTFYPSGMSLNASGLCSGNITPGSAYDSDRLVLGLLRSMKGALRNVSRRLRHLRIASMGGAPIRARGP